MSEWTGAGTVSMEHKEVYVPWVQTDRCLSVDGSGRVKSEVVALLCEVCVRMKTEAEIREQLGFHKMNLEQWKSGYLTPTEPDEEERNAVMRELKAAIFTLEWVLNERGPTQASRA